MTRRPMGRQTPDEEAGRLAMDYVRFRTLIEGRESEQTFALRLTRMR